MSFAKLSLRPELNAPTDNSYRIDADVEYRVMEQDTVVTAGMGRTKRMSSSQVVLESDGNLPIGRLVELEVTWPVWMDNTVELKLHILGRTTRTQDKFIIVDILRHEFRTVDSQTAGMSGETQSVPAVTHAGTVCESSQPEAEPDTAIPEAV
jgi:hypothetical protein